MGKKKLFKEFSEKKQKHYERLARLEYGPDNVNESIRRWNSYSAAQKQAVLDEGNAIYSAVVKAIKAELSPQSEEVQRLLARWHQHIRCFYEPTLEILRGLGELYVSNPEFAANFEQMHPKLAEFMRSGINTYVDDLETAELERLFADDANRSEG